MKTTHLIALLYMTGSALFFIGSLLNWRITK